MPARRCAVRWPTASTDRCATRRKQSLKTPGRPFDYRVITNTIQRSLAAAGLHNHAGLMQGVTNTVERALAAGGLVAPDHTPTGHTFEGEAREVGPDDAGRQGPEGEGAEAGEFLTQSFTNHAGTRAYKLFVPAIHSAGGTETLPLVVMLHGCSQTPDDFVAGTRMNALAQRHGFLVAWPAQAAGASRQGCWRWYSSAHQAREGGEPAILAGITGEVMSRYRVDRRRIFAAGMSAGGAMAVILGATYPELFAAIGVHSGLPYGAAHDLPSALAAMKGGKAPPSSLGVPAIVFHGDRDPTVNVRNGAAIVEQAVRGRVAAPDQREAHTGRSPDGRVYHRTVHAEASGRAVVEHWVLSGAGHAWSGGCASGSFTDAGGPDASAEMIRFFLSQPGR